MSINIARHQLPAADLLELRKRSSDASLNSLHKRLATAPHVLEVLQKRYREAAAIRSASDVDDPQVADALRRAAQCTALGFRLARPAGEAQVSGLIGDETLTLPSFGPRNLLNLATWTEGLFCAIATRQADLVTTLCEADSLRAALEAPGVIVPRYQMAYDLMLAAWATNADDAMQRYAEVQERLPPRGEDVYVDLLIRPMLDLFARVLTDNAAEFNGMLGEAVAAHRSYYSAPDRWGGSLGWIALGPMAVARDAQARGWTVDIVSPYMPRAVFNI